MTIKLLSSDGRIISVRLKLYPETATEVLRMYGAKPVLFMDCETGKRNGITNSSCITFPRCGNLFTLRNRSLNFPFDVQKKFQNKPKAGRVYRVVTGTGLSPNNFICSLNSFVTLYDLIMKYSGTTALQFITVH